MINSINSFVSGSPSDIAIQALRETEVLVLPKKSYLEYIYHSEYTMKFHIEVIQDLVLSLMEREFDLLTLSPRNRYNRVLKRSPQLFQHIPLKYIASYLRMTPETLSRLRKK